MSTDTVKVSPFTWEDTATGRQVKATVTHADPDKSGWFAIPVAAADLARPRMKEMAEEALQKMIDAYVERGEKLVFCTSHKGNYGIPWQSSPAGTSCTVCGAPYHHE